MGMTDILIARSRNDAVTIALENLVSSTTRIEVSVFGILFSRHPLPVLEVILPLTVRCEAVKLRWMWLILLGRFGLPE
jgi:hypothetical protein